MNESDDKTAKVLEVFYTNSVGAINDHMKYLGVAEARRKLKGTVPFSLQGIIEQIAYLVERGLLMHQTSANHGERYRISPTGIDHMRSLRP